MLVPLEKPNFSDRVRFSLYGLPGYDDYDEDPETRDENEADDLLSLYVDKLKKELQKYLPKLERWTKEYARFTTASYQGWKKGDATEKARTLESAKELLRQIKSMGWGVQNMSSELRRIRDVADSIVSPSGKMHKQGRHSWRHGKEWEKIYKICRFFRKAVSDMEEGCEHTIKYNGQYLVTTPSAPTVEVRLIKENFNSVR